MNEDMGEMIKNFSKMLNGQEIPENVKNILNSMNSNPSSNNPSGNNNSNNNSTDNNFSNNNFSSNSSSDSNNSNNNPFGDFDMNTILKMQKIMNSINNDKQSDTRANLLRSLKPYLKDSRKSKVDQYIQLMKMGKIFEIMNPLGGDNKNV